MHVRVKAFPILLMSFAILCGCASGLDLRQEKEQRITELHERLSYVISRNGFTHGLRGFREEGRNIDSVYISLSLDSLKRRYLTLDHMLADVARICADKDFAKVDIRIELSAGETADLQYLSSIIEPGIAAAPNVRIIQAHETTNDIVITTVHD